MVGARLLEKDLAIGQQMVRKQARGWVSQHGSADSLEPYRQA
jgi:hypothetical protein